jgi:hypothetical protein
MISMAGGAMSVYLYALLSAAPSCETGRGVCAERLRVMVVGNLVALVGDVRQPPAPTAVALRAQDGILRRLAAGVDGVLPVRFGTLLADDAALAESLELRRAPLARALGRVCGCEQMTLRVWGEIAVFVSPGTGGDERERAPSVPVLDSVRRRLGDLVREERAELHARAPLLVTVQHLIRRGAGGRYLDEIDAARDSLRPWRVSVTGPGPVYDFAEEAA